MPVIIILILSLFLCSCRSPDDIVLQGFEQSTSSSVSEAQSEEITLEPYQEESEGSEDSTKYEYLEAVPLATDNAYTVVYGIKDAVTVKGDTAQSSAHGISLYSRLYENSDLFGGSVEEFILNEFKNSIKSDDLKISDTIEGEGCWIKEISWSVTDADQNKVYPCAAYIKVDDLGEGNCLGSILVVDNQETDEYTEKLFTEILDWLGIVFS